MSPWPKISRCHQYLGLPPTEISREQARAYHIEIMALLDAPGPPALACERCCGTGALFTDDEFDAVSKGLCPDCDKGQKAQAPWTKSERAVLLRLERRWRQRALGYDKRWLIMGAKAGRLPQAVENEIRPAPRRRHPAFEEP